MNKINNKITAISLLYGILCFNLISAGNDSNYEQCYNIGRNRICYHRETNELRSWNESMQICDSMNSSLPYFQNWDEQTTFNKYLYTHLQTNLTMSNLWTCGQRHVFDNWTSVYGDIWNNYVPLQVSANGWQYGTHVILTGEQELIAEKPSLANLYMCQYSADLCKNIERKLSLRKTCFEINTGFESWYEARNKCLLGGGDLLYLNDQSDIEKLKMIAEGHGGSTAQYKFWIGLRKISWLWKSSFTEQPIEVTFTNWNHSSDYERIFRRDLCIYVDKSNFRWKTTDCNEAMTVICQRREVVEPIENVSLSSPTQTTKQIQSDWTNYVIFGSVIGFAVLLCIASITIAVLIVKRNSSVAGKDTQDDGRYQGLKTVQTYYDNYDKIDADNGYYEDIANLVIDCNYESIADDNYLELVDTEVYDNLEEVGDDTEADRASQLENVTEAKVENVTEAKVESVTEAKGENMNEEKVENMTEEKVENMTEEKVEDVTEEKV